MNNETFQRLFEAAHQHEAEVLDKKGKDYTRGDEDRLASFKRQGKDLNLDPKQIWVVHAGKQYDAIMAYIKGGTESEPIEERITDLRNYLILFLAMIKEEEPKGETVTRRSPLGRF